MKVHGFDFVPEDLRSRTYIAAAKSVKDAHFAMNNFYNEPDPMKALASLGKTIPMPALPAVMSAVLCVVLGNPYGVSHAAMPYARQVLQALTKERWRYYLDECLRGDDAILAKISSNSIVGRWLDVVSAYKLSEAEVVKPDLKKLLEASDKREKPVVQSIASRMFDQVRVRAAP
ncbi:MAG TPA: hypothetical protein VHC69_22175 [Polyangiaceae bacterium]|nr:hypothetical protein [Polyangiaceae bacterium]